MLILSMLLPAYVLHGPLTVIHDPLSRSIQDQSSRAFPLRMQENDGPLKAAQTAFAIFQASKAEGMDFKQSVADAIAGEYDRVAITAAAKEAASSAPLVLFTWESSPACKKALKLIFKRP